MGKLEKRNKDRMKKLKTASVAWRTKEGRHKISWITNKRRGFTRRKERPLQDFLKERSLQDFFKGEAFTEFF